MAITTYAELKTAIENWLHRGTSLASYYDDFIDLCEADLQVRGRLSHWETEATVTVTSGSGSLPSDFVHMLSCKYGSQTSLLDYVGTDLFKAVDAANSGGGEPICYTILGDTLRVAPSASGSAYITYQAKFTALSDSATTNSMLTNFPDAYLYGSLLHASDFIKDDAGMAKYKALFEDALTRVRTYMVDRKFGNALQVRVA